MSIRSLLGKLGIGLAVAGQPAGAQAFNETVEQLREAVIARLRAESRVTEILPDPGDPAQFMVVTRDSAGQELKQTIDVGNVYGRLYVLRNDADRTGAIENLVQGVLAAGQKGEIDFARVFANVRYAGGPTIPVTGLPSEALMEELVGDVAIVYQLDTPHSLAGLARIDVGDRSMEEVRRIARQNILREMAKLREEPVNDTAVAYQIDDNTPITPAIVLTDEFWAKVEKRFPRGALLIMRQRDEVAVLDKASPDSLSFARQLIDMAKQRNVDFLSECIFEWRGGRLVVIED